MWSYYHNYVINHNYTLTSRYTLLSFFLKPHCMPNPLPVDQSPPQCYHHHMPVFNQYLKMSQDRDGSHSIPVLSPVILVSIYELARAYTCSCAALKRRVEYPVHSLIGIHSLQPRPHPLVQVPLKVSSIVYYLSHANCPSNCCRGVCCLTPP